MQNQLPMHVDMINRSFVFAYAAHAATGQKRKYTGEPYIVHPIEVATIVSTVSHSHEMIAAALLHDVVEDTEVTIEEIEEMFGLEISNYVGWLTDISKKRDGNRATRKAIDRAHIHMAPFPAQTIKVADLIANTQDICKCDKHFAKVYIEEKKLLLQGMTANKVLMKRAWKIVEDYEYDQYILKYGVPPNDSI